jgi:hypothetical protein
MIKIWLEAIFINSLARLEEERMCITYNIFIILKTFLHFFILL